MTIPGNMHQTFQILAPISTHYRQATCEEIECDAWRNGWKTIVPMNSEAAQYIRSGTSGRRYSEVTRIDSTMREFIFEPGQKCFAADKHRVPLEREPIFIKRVGASGRMLHANAEDWRDDMSEQLDRIKEQREG